MGEALNEGGRCDERPSVWIRGNGTFDRSGEVGSSVGVCGRAAVSSILIVGARGRAWSVGGGEGSSGFDGSEDMLPPVVSEEKRGRDAGVVFACTSCVENAMVNSKAIAVQTRVVGHYEEPVNNHSAAAGSNGYGVTAQPGQRSANTFLSPRPQVIWTWQGAIAGVY